MKKNFNRVLSFILCVAMCFGFCTIASAASVGLSLNLDPAEAEVGNLPSTVSMTVGTTSALSIMSFSAKAYASDSRITISEIKNGDKELSAANSNNGKFAYLNASESSVSTWATVVFSIPADLPAGTYTLGVSSVNASRSDNSNPLSGITEKSVTFTVSAHEHSFETDYSYNDTHHWYAATCGHNVTDGYAQHNGGKATCSAKAVCADCGQSYGSFSDDHDFGETAYTWLNNGQTCVAKRVCKTNSSHYEEAYAKVTGQEKTPATETTEGTTTYTATFDVNWATTQKKDVQDIPTLDHVHVWGEVSYEWLNNDQTCVAKRVCTKNSEHIQTANATITSEEKTPATETEKGTTTYTATFNVDWATTQKKDVQDIPVITPTPELPDVPGVIIIPGIGGESSLPGMPGKDTAAFDTALSVYQAHAAGISFVDVAPADWFYDSVMALAYQGVVNGYPDNSYRPQGEVTWGEALKLVMKAVGYADQAPTGDHWASGYMTTAIANGLIPGAVELNSAVTRAEVGDLAAKALKLAPETIANPFDDEAPASALALYEAGIIKGSADDGKLLYRSESTITRAEIATIIWRVYCSR